MPENINWQIQKPEVAERLIDEIMKESSEEARAEEIFAENYPLGWEERHKF